MPARNVYHDAVRDALAADGWTITDDPLGLVAGARRLHVDLGAERLALGAERAGERIAVEVQSFLSTSAVDDFHSAIGQYIVYRAVLRVRDPDRELYLTVPASAYRGVFSERLGGIVAQDIGLKVLVFHPVQRRLVRWIK